MAVPRNSPTSTSRQATSAGQTSSIAPAKEMEIPIDSLDTHPFQHLYKPCTPAEDEALRASIQRDGQRDPIHVVPVTTASGEQRYVLLDGLRRKSAISELGHTEIIAVVHFELVGKDAATINRKFLDYNPIRRQLSALEQAASLLWQFELKMGLKPGKLRHSRHEEEALAQLTKFLPHEPRHIRRIFRILLAPEAVYHAVRDGRLGHEVAEKIESLDPALQNEIAERLASTPSATRAENAAMVAKHLSPRRNPRSVSPSRALVAFVKRLDPVVASAPKFVDRIDPVTIAAHRTSLLQAHKITAALLARSTPAKVAAAKRRQSANIDQLATDVADPFADAE